MTGPSPLRRLVLGVLVLGVLGQVVLSQRASSDPTVVLVWYDVVALLAVGTAAIGVRQLRPTRLLAWSLVVAGFGGWVVGELVYTAEQVLLGAPGFPAASDGVYLGSYALLAGGLLGLVRDREGRPDRTVLLDAVVVAAGVTVLTTVTVVQPLAADGTSSLAARLVGSAYPVADVVLVVLAARLWSLAEPNAAHRALSAALLLMLAADLSFDVAQVLGASTAWLDPVWLSGYVALAAAATSRSARHLGARPPVREVVPRRRLLLLGIGLALPWLTLVVDEATGNRHAWPVVSIGGLALSVLVVVRMAGLLDVVQVQAVQLAALARSDALTGAPNRRTWDHELSTACRESRDGGEPLSVAILDLDHFKLYNDTYGHQAGDLLLREAVATWTEELGDDGLLARYGGEEFTLLLPGHDLARAAATVRRLAPLTPGGQTFSAGVAVWDPGSDPSQAVAQADQALYVAKRNGRDRVVIHPGGGAVPADLSELPEFTVRMQPIVDTRLGVVTAHEALCRFADDGVDPPSAFRVAHENGWGDLLEAAAILQALATPGRPEGTELFVNASMTALGSDRFWALLPADLTGVVVELSEEAGPLCDEELSALLDRARERGARIALDDLGNGAAELARMARLRPDVIKIDRILVHGCADDTGRCAVISALVAYADILGVLVCAEGVERASDLDRLRGLGISCFQGFLFGVPSPGWAKDLAVCMPDAGADVRSSA